MVPRNDTDHGTSKLSAILTASITNGNETIEYKNETESIGSILSEYFKALSSNGTEYWDNSTENSTSNTSFKDSLPNLSDMKTGLSHRDLSNLEESFETVDLNKTYTESGTLSILASLTMITFFYYVPRMIYYRASNLSKDSKHSSFVPLLCLSLIVCAGAGIHVANAYYHATHNMMASLLAGALGEEEEEFDRMTPFVYKSLTAAINRAVSPVAGLLCLQQISTHSKYNLQIFQSGPIQFIISVGTTIFVFGYSFVREYAFMISIDPGPLYPDRIHVDPIDLIFPIITTFLFCFAKHAISRQSLYTTEKYGPNGPTTLDRVSKVVVFQTVMTFFAICAIFWSPSEEEEKELLPTSYTFQYFFITAQTPFIHFVLFRSLLRSRKSTRICFLVCCHSGEKISTADNEVELNQHPRTNEPSEKNEEEEEDQNKEENTMETLDHNKIMIMPEGNLEEKPEMKTE